MMFSEEMLRANAFMHRLDCIVLLSKVNQATYMYICIGHYIICYNNLSNYQSMKSMIRVKILCNFSELELSTRKTIS